MLTDDETEEVMREKKQREQVKFSVNKNINMALYLFMFENILKNVFQNTVFSCQVGKVY